MEIVTSVLSNQTLVSFVNVQVFAAVLLALLVYRVVAPLIDYLNPVIMLLNGITAIKVALFNTLFKQRPDIRAGRQMDQGRRWFKKLTL